MSSLLLALLIAIYVILGSIITTIVLRKEFTGINAYRNDPGDVAVVGFMFCCGLVAWLPILALAGLGRLLLTKTKVDQ